MLNRTMITAIENIGCVNSNGKRIYGTAALLHILHRPYKEIVTPENIKRGKEFVDSFLLR